MRMDIMTVRIFALLCFGLWFVLAAPALADTYWVSSNGEATWVACRSEIPLTGVTACSLKTATSNAAAGDVVFLRGGTYMITGNYAAGLAPSNSGSAGRWIAFKAYAGETPLLISDYANYKDQTGLSISNKSYIKIDGIHFKNFRRWAQLTNYANHNEVANCRFYSDTGEEGSLNDTLIGFLISGLCSGGDSYVCYSTHNWVHHNTFSKAHGYTSNACLEGADVIRIGYPYGTGDDAGLNNNNTIENNVIEYGGHGLLFTYGLYNVVKNNVMHNEPWWTKKDDSCPWPADYVDDVYDNKYGHRGLQISRDYPDHDAYVLVEGNRIGYAGANPNNDGAENIDLAAASIITRYNYIYGAMSSGLMYKYDYSTNNKVYNNTLYHNGFGYSYYYNDGDGCPDRGRVCPTGTAAIAVYTAIARPGSVAVNNLIYDSGAYGYFGRDITVKSGGAPATSYIEIGSNYLTSNGDPHFTNPSLADTSSTTLPDLSLQSDSPAIDAATYLTKANGQGTQSTKLIVDDAMYFQDGTWGSSLAMGKTMFPDWIAIGTISNTVQIASIDYATKTISLATPVTWNDRAPIWLYKKSDGAVVLTGLGPDFGASEFKMNGFLSTTKNLRVIP
jgi:hypothetical protein